MKKLFSFVVAALISVAMFASREAVPSDADLASYATKTYTMCIYSDNVCNDIVLIGTYVSWDATAELLKFQAVEGFEGWYVVTWDDESGAAEKVDEGGVQAKPVQLTATGTFSWDYQLNDKAQLLRGSANILPGNTNEVDIMNIQPGIVVIEVPGWKNNPCSAVYHIYNVTFVSPDCNEEDYVVPAISGGFNGWAQEAMEMNELKTAERQQVGLPGAVFEASFKAAEGSKFKFRSAEEWGKDWTNQLKEYNAEEDAWQGFSGAGIVAQAENGNLVLGEETNLTFDLGDPEKYSWTNCENNYVEIGDLYYNLKKDKTAEVTYQLEWDADNYKDLTTANIPASVTYNGTTYSVTSIGDWAFSGCTGLTSVTIPNSVTSIGNNAFDRCSGLTSVIWNAKNCYTAPFDSISSQITSFTFGNEVEYIPANLCNGMSNLTSVTIPGSVTSIGNYAFSWCTGLTSIEIPNSVTSIGGSAFYGCTGLTSVTIGNSVTSIGDGAFYYCTGLTSVTIPNNVTSIGESAFYGCWSLTSVTIGNSVTSIGDGAFYYCTGLTSVIWNAKNCADFASNNTPFYANYYDQEMHYDISFDLRPQITSFTFGNEVEYIPANLCNGMSNLTSVTIPNSVTSIGEYAFSNCSGLTSVTIGNSVTSIGSYAFCDCSGLTSVTIGNSVTSIGSYAFCDCSGLTSVTIGNSVTSIGNSAFSRCTGLTSIDIPNSVTSIGGSAFYGCTGLTSVTIGNSVTGIGREAFDGCTGLTSMEAPAGFFDVPEGSWPYCTKILNHVTVNGGELTENALLFINRSYKTLQTLDVSGVTNTEFADEAFKGCYNLQQLVLPEGLQKVSYMMVAGCVNLQSINIPASVEEIEQRAFEDCRSIQTITFGGAPAGAPGRFNAPAASASQLRRIGNWAFYNAHELQDLDIPEGVTEIGDGAFYGCTYLEEMVLPSSVQTIGDNTFALCAKLQKITVNSVTPPSIQAKTFFDVKRQIPVYVPDEAVSAYENDTYWQEFDIQGASQMPTGIDNISSSLQGGDRGRLILHNGQIFILRGEKVYTVTGQEVR